MNTLFEISLDVITFNPIQDGTGGKKSRISFSPVTSTNIGISPENFLILVLTLLPHWCKILGLDLVPVSNNSTWTKTTPQKKWFFYSDPYKIEVTITSLIEMLELPNFGHMTTPTIQFDSRNKISLVSSYSENMTS